VTEYTYTNKETEQKENHECKHPSIHTPQVSCHTNPSKEGVPIRIRDTCRVCQESSSLGPECSDPVKIDGKHNPEDKAKCHGKDVKTDVLLLSSSCFLHYDVYKIQNDEKGT
jgi:hypothetical protein